MAISTASLSQQNPHIRTALLLTDETSKSSRHSDTILDEILLEYGDFSDDTLSEMNRSESFCPTTESVTLYDHTFSYNKCIRQLCFCLLLLLLELIGLQYLPLYEHLEKTYLFATLLRSSSLPCSRQFSSRFKKDKPLSTFLPLVKCLQKLIDRVPNIISTFYVVAKSNGLFKCDL
ncbi:hypothetical protein Bhyg_04580 [Pseudolycoriella hygida]|uniref:Uncharacterized protein n=1 Tax=Pseudolycoriella hygida TaxID=35572 RepID=A0A9Q0NFI8_9DIPT|nr:hypothetical protein Bhyg_04580 [Pseudolycoriella hygida]